MEALFNDYIKQQVVSVLERLQTLREEIALRTQEAQKFELELQRLQEYISHASIPLPTMPSSPDAMAHAPLRQTDKRDATQLIANVLVRANAPLHYKTILERLKIEEAYAMPGKDPAANLTARLSLAKKKFVGLGNGMYRLRSPEETEPKTITQKSLGSHKPSMAEVARQVLEEAQHPMRIIDIARALGQKGHMGGKWAKSVLGTALRTNKIFTRVAEGVYALQAWPDVKKQPLSNIELADQPVLALTQNSAHNQSEQKSLVDSDSF